MIVRLYAQALALCMAGYTRSMRLIWVVVALLPASVFGCSQASPPAQVTATSEAVTLADLRDGDCIAGLSPSGDTRQPLQRVACGNDHWDARVLALLRDGTYNCPSATNQFKAIALDSPTSHSITICLQTR